MLSKPDTQFAFVFAVLLMAELICGTIETLAFWHHITKPLLLISLLFYFLSQSKHLGTTTHSLTVLALMFSLAGDILLLFDTQSDLYFILGLISFLMAHLMYSVVFYKRRNPKINPIVLIGILALYTFGFFSILKKGLNNLLIPVIIYMVVILIMVITSYLRRYNVPKYSFILVFNGALLFVISDSILALHKFYMAIPFASIFVMLTYGLAQYFIVLGLLKQR